jgi:farnesyl-diphosphate farnesyltransferase
LRDLPSDLHKGRCYLPSLELDQVGLLPSILLSPVNESRFRPIYHHYLDVAESHLKAGWVYTNALPRGQMRVRLACAWPILIGARTIKRLRAANVLELRQGVKISRGRVYGIMLHSVLAYPLPSVWRKLFVMSRNAIASGEKLR